MTKTGQEDLDKELLDHWLRDPGNNTLQQISALVVNSLIAAIVSVLWKPA